MTDDFLVTEDIAKLMHTSPSTVRYWEHTGRAPKSFKVGRRRLYARSDVEAWIEAARSEAIA